MVLTAISTFRDTVPQSENPKTELQSLLLEMDKSIFIGERHAAKIFKGRLINNGDPGTSKRQVANYLSDARAYHAFAKGSALEEKRDTERAAGVLGELTVFTLFDLLEEDDVNITIASAVQDDKGIDFFVKLDGKRYPIDVTTANGGVLTDKLAEGRTIALLPIRKVDLVSDQMTETTWFVEDMLLMDEPKYTKRELASILQELALYNLDLVKRYSNIFEYKEGAERTREFWEHVNAVCNRHQLADSDWL